MLGTTIAAIFFTGLASPGESSVPVSTPNYRIQDSFTYQGILRDGTGVAGPIAPLADGQYDLSFQLFDSAVGGTAVAPPFSPGTLTIHRGLLTVDVPFSEGTFSNEDRWLEISVGPPGGPLTALVPRQSISQSPAAHHAVTSEMTLSQVYDNGATIVTGPESGRVNIRGPEGLQLGGSLTNGRMRVLDDDNMVVFEINGSQLDLPAGSVDSTEIQNESGLAFDETNSSITGTSSPQVISATSVQVPSSGFLLITSSGQVRLSHVNGVDTLGTIELRLNGSSLANAVRDIGMFDNTPTGTYFIPYSITVVAPISAGTHSIEAVGFGTPTNGRVRYQRSQVSVVFLPTNYDAP